jgi:polyhydroxyalkanoate synthesis regulator phasin
MEKQPQWKDRFNEIVQTCQEELKKTTEIGKKMLSASKTNTQLNESYEELGHLAFKAIEKGELTWDHMRVQELIKTIKTCEKDLEEIEKDVSNIKKTP